MSGEILKQDIVKALKTNRRELTSIIDGLRQLDETDDRRLNRIIAQEIVLTLFKFIDTLTSTEIDIHNFMKRRG